MLNQLADHKPGVAVVASFRSGLVNWGERVQQLQLPKFISPSFLVLLSTRNICANPTCHSSLPHLLVHASPPTTCSRRRCADLDLYHNSRPPSHSLQSSFPQTTPSHLHRHSPLSITPLPLPPSYLCTLLLPPYRQCLPPIVSLHLTMMLLQA